MALSKLLDQSGMASLWQQQTSVMRGVVLMCLSTLTFSSMHVTVHHVSGELPALQIAFFRNFFA